MHIADQNQISHRKVSNEGIKFHSLTERPCSLNRNFTVEFVRKADIVKIVFFHYGNSAEL